MSGGHGATVLSHPAASDAAPSWDAPASTAENQTAQDTIYRKPSVRNDGPNSSYSRTPLHDIDASNSSMSRIPTAETDYNLAAHGDAESDPDMQPRNPETSLAPLADQRHAKDGSADENQDTDMGADGALDLVENDQPTDRGNESFRKKLDEIYGPPTSDENSKWIHRDKLARIESAELQAAGIVLPKTRERARSKSISRTRSQRERSPAKANGTEDGALQKWDVRLPDEIQSEGAAQGTAGAGVKASRIPVAKTSHVPVPAEHIEREKITPRKREGSPGEDDSIVYPKPRQRSGSVGHARPKTAMNGAVAQPAVKRTNSSPKSPNSPPRKVTGTASVRKSSQSKPANGATRRPKTRGAPSRDSTRSFTRSGERELSMSPKPMEGEPPWMVSAYRPDPRLPPDQQLLPTVARRLQQEKWEREGKFGNIYDKEFRPLTDEGFLLPPGLDEKSGLETKVDVGAQAEPTGAEVGAEKGLDTGLETSPPEEMSSNEKEGGIGGEGQISTDWPLKPEVKNALLSPVRSPTRSHRSNSYTTIPKIAERRPSVSPLPSPAPFAGLAPTTSAVIKIPEPPEDPVPTKKKKAMCGLCVVM